MRQLSLLGLQLGSATLLLLDDFLEFLDAYNFAVPASDRPYFLSFLGVAKFFSEL
jgi:hypothetical protein